MKRPPRHVTVPLLLALYLAAMAWIGREGLLSGQTSPLQYFGTLAITIGIIVLLYFFLKKRDRLRRERLDDIEKNNKQIKKQ